MRATVQPPSDDELCALRLHYTLPQIAEFFAVSLSTVKTWVREAAGRGAPCKDEDTRAAPVIDRDNMEQVCRDLLQRAVDIVWDPTITAPRDRLAQAKLAVDLHGVLAARIDAAPPVVKKDRTQLVDTVKRATASATKLRAVG